MRFLCCFVFLLPALALGQGPPVAELISDPFVESYQPEVSVSGNVIVGVMTVAAAKAMVDDRIAVHVRTDPAPRNLCLSAATRDGIYTSRNEYQLPKDASGPVHLPYRSKLADKVRGYPSDELALTATAGACDSGSSDYYLLSTKDSPGDSDVVIYLNSFGATDVFYQIGSTVEACHYFSEGRRTAYDFVCRPKSLAWQEGAAVTILRERFGRELPAIELRILGVGK